VKVIFIEDVRNVARAGQTRVVANGYARNYLFPRKLAVLADSNAASSVEAHIKKVAKLRALEEAEMAEVAGLIRGTEITLKAKVGENERLYGSVTGADIAGELSKTAGREVDKRKIDLVEPIRQVGVYDVTVRFTRDITALVTVTVMSDAEDAVRPVRAAMPAEAIEEPAPKAEKKEKKPKAEKKPKKTEDIEEKAEKAAEPAQAVKEEKPPREKKAKPEKAEKEAAPAEAEKKEKKPRAEKKPKKSEVKAEKEPQES
jgi:large subunit ribosomal protein L9